MTNDKIVQKYDLEHRTAQFGENVLKLCKSVRRDEVTRPLINQLVRCSTSVGANYCEADDAESRADFRHKIGICKKEARESKHFIRMLVSIEPTISKEARLLWFEAQELNLIFNAIYKKVK